MNDCLILVDLQNDYFSGGNMELFEMDKAAAKARLLLDQFRKENSFIVHIKHVSARPGATFFLPNTPGVKINELVAPQQDETVIAKHFPNSFRDTALLKTLNEKEAKNLVICGAMSHMCIDATTRAAFDLGFSCIVAEDACTTRDLIFKGQTVKASDVHAAFMAALSIPFAKVVSTASIIAARE